MKKEGKCQPWTFYKCKYKTGKNYVDAWKKNTCELFIVYT